MFNIKFMPDDKAVRVSEGTTVLEAAKTAGVLIDSPCGGNGTCGKCKVIIDGKELRACQSKTVRDMTVFLPGAEKGHQILASGSCAANKLNPSINAIEIKVKRASIGGCKSDWEAVSQAIKNAAGIIPLANLDVIINIHEILAKTEYAPEAVLFGDQLLDLRKPGGRLCAMAFDIGTTTVVGYLLDLKTGENLATASMLNPQAAYGADVIRRAGYAAEHGVDELTGSIRKTLDALTLKAAAEAGVSTDEIYLITAVGNSCMHHLFLGISPAPLTVAPYLPVFRELVTDDAEKFGITSNRSAKLIFIPNIGGFVGADTVGAILACGMDISEETTLIIDIGTNGEIALGNKNRIETCSTAAGPAFEGALIECGMRGAAGAVDHVSLIDGKLTFSVIDDVEAVGICGSGLIDMIAEMVRTGIVDEGGRIVSNEELNGDAAFFAPMLSGEGALRRFSITKDVYVSQKDVREVQLAKGAMAAGLSILLKDSNITFDDISKVMIAGAFGNYMSPDSACGISLIPKELRGKIIAVGNAAGLGAKAAALDREVLSRAWIVSERAGYLELAVHPDFHEVFVENLEF